MHRKFISGIMKIVYVYNKYYMRIYVQHLYRRAK